MKTKSNTTTPNTDPVEIGLSATVRKKSLALLTEVLADQHVLYLKTRNFHWNLTDYRFSSLHPFFESQYKEIEQAIDQTAERIRMLGYPSPGSMTEFLKLANLKEVVGKSLSGESAISLLKNDHENVIRNLREGIDVAAEAGDVGTEDFLTGLLRAHEQAAWMLRSSLS